jgi:hypothetical protein
MAFGLGLQSEERPPGAWQEGPLHDEPGLQIRALTPAGIQERWSGFGGIDWEGVIDGAQFVVERGLEGDRRFVHGEPPAASGAPTEGTRAVHHLDAGAGVLACAPVNPGEPSWWRLVLDSVLFTVALARGYEALHAGAIATPTGAIAIAAATGGGKSTLLAELIGRGVALLADDVVVLEPRGALPPLAHPGPPVMTVPAERVPILDGESPAPTIVSIEDERWIAVPVRAQPLELRALVVLDRRPAGPGGPSSPSLRRIERPLAPLLDALMRFPDTPEREQTRFELAGAIASQGGVWRLTASLDTPPDVLADKLMGGEL